MSRSDIRENLRVRVGIVTMFSGENEIGIQKASLDSQDHVDWEQVLIEGLSKVDAHSAFRSIVQGDRLKADLYVKLDADMVFVGSSSLKWIVDVFQSDPNLCHLVMPVQDWPSDEPIYGAHAYRVGVTFPYGGTRLFTDPNPKITGTKRTLDIQHDPVVAHMADPSESQSCLLGYHRALKVVQKGAFIKDYKNARFQLDYLERISVANAADPDPRRECILLGACAVLSGGLAASTFEKSDATFDKIQARYSRPEVRTRALKKMAPGGWGFRSWKFRYGWLPSVWSVPALHLHRKAYKVWTAIKRIGS